jgi:hypothetical protein
MFLWPYAVFGPAGKKRTFFRLMLTVAPRYFRAEPRTRTFFRF